MKTKSMFMFAVTMDGHYLLEALCQGSDVNVMDDVYMKAFLLRVGERIT
jgi:hypothetical protein